MRQGVIGIVVLFLLVACGRATPTPSPEIVQTAIAQTQVAIANAATATPIPSATSSLTPSSTPSPSPTPPVTRTPRPVTPTITPTPQPPTPEERFAFNFLAEQEQGGIKVEVARLVVAKPHIAEQVFGINLPDDYFEGKQTAVELLFRVTNSSEQTLTFHPEQALVAVSGEQVDLSVLRFEIFGVGEAMGGEYLPGSTLFGGLWFGLDRVSVPEATTLRISIDAPVAEDGTEVGEDFFFDIDISAHEWVPLAEELR